VTFSVYQYVRFVSANITTSLVTLYTVPAATQAIVKDININNYGVSSVTLSIFQMPNTGAVLQGTVIPAGGTVHWTGLIVLGAGETISAQASAAGTYATISGQTGV
jgi:hypothetical protein